VGRRGGEKRVGERMDFCKWSCLCGAIGNGAVDCDLLVDGASGFRVFDRRGGGTAGFSFSSSSCISLADLKEDGDSGPFSPSLELDSLWRTDVDRLMSSDCGRACREPLCGGGFGGGGVFVLRAANCEGFCLIGGDLIGSFCGVWK
jgi:hypothetical protein